MGLLNWMALFQYRRKLNATPLALLHYASRQQHTMKHSETITRPGRIGVFLASTRRTITLTKEQYRLLDIYVAAIAAEPETAPFTCVPMEGIDFVWIIHPGLYNDVRMAHWDDMAKLERLGIIEILHSERDSKEYSFTLTPIARVVHARCTEDQRAGETITVSIDANG